VRYDAFRRFAQRCEACGRAGDLRDVEIDNPTWVKQCVFCARRTAATEHLAAGPARPLGGLTDAELVLLDVAHEGATEVVLLDARLGAAVRDEMGVRHLSASMVAGHLVDRALGALR
jgi:hypothetical protein